MITFHSDHVSLPIDTCKALLLFAAPTKKPSRPEFAGIGISNSRLVATDGHALVTFSAVQGDTSGYDKTIFPRDYVELELKLAQAHKRQVFLEYAHLNQQLRVPDIDTMIPTIVRTESRDALPIVAEYLARLVAVQQACHPKGSNTAPLVELTGCSTCLSPIRFDCGSDNSHERATVIFMPTRAKP